MRDAAFRLPFFIVVFGGRCNWIARLGWFHPRRGGCVSSAPVRPCCRFARMLVVRAPDARLIERRASHAPTGRSLCCLFSLRLIGVFVRTTVVVS